MWDLDKLEFVRTFNNPDGEIVWFEFVDNLLASARIHKKREKESGEEEKERKEARRSMKRRP